MNDQNTPSAMQQSMPPRTVEPAPSHTRPRRGNFFAVLLILIGVRMMTRKR